MYKYVVDDEVVYVGKTKNLSTRIREHNYCCGIDEKFAPYVGRASVYYAELPNSGTMSAVESILIAIHRPVLNVVQKPKEKDDLIPADYLPPLNWQVYYLAPKALTPSAQSTIWNENSIIYNADTNSLECNVSDRRHVAHLAAILDQAREYGDGKERVTRFHIGEASMYYGLQYVDNWEEKEKSCIEAMYNVAILVHKGRKREYVHPISQIQYRPSIGWLETFVDPWVGYTYTVTNWDVCSKVLPLLIDWLKAHPPRELVVA